MSMLKFPLSDAAANQGFTLVELIVYVGLLTLVMSGMMVFMQNIMYVRVKNQTYQAVIQNLRWGSERIGFEIRNAASINSVTATTLSLQMADSTRDPTVFDVSDGRLRMGYGSSGLCPVSSPCFLTDNQVVVTNLGFTNLSSGGSTNIQTSLSIKSNTSRPEWQFTQTYLFDAELRSR